jgi:ssDNA-binding Zn-finger/Zn-ribbon topoisomerase 1
VIATPIKSISPSDRCFFIAKTHLSTK